VVVVAVWAANHVVAAMVWDLTHTGFLVKYAAPAAGLEADPVVRVEVWAKVLVVPAVALDSLGANP
jgi:hypothetical protein